MDDERRKKVDRRVDPNAWTASHRSTVKMIFALCVAGFFMVMGTVLIFWAFTNSVQTKFIYFVGIGMIGGGFLAAFPSRTMPIISVVLKKFGFSKLEIPPSSLTMMDIVPIDEDEDE